MPYVHSPTFSSISSPFLRLNPNSQFSFFHTKEKPSTPCRSAYRITKSIHFNFSRRSQCFDSSFRAPRYTASVAEVARKENILTKPSAAEVSRTIMDLSSVGTLSTLDQDGQPLSFGVRFAVDEHGAPILCLSASNRPFSVDDRCSLHVQFEQSQSRTPQCTLQGKLKKPSDGMTLKRMHALWTTRFQEEVDEDLLYALAFEQVLQIDDFGEDGVWVTSVDYMNASPDPLRNSAENLVNEMNSKHMEDVLRFCCIFLDTGFPVSDAKMIWVDRLGFDVHLSSRSCSYEARIPFPREVTDERGAKSSFNCMSQVAWEVEKNYTVPDFEKVKDLKEVRCWGEQRKDKVLEHGFIS